MIRFFTPLVLSAMLFSPLAGQQGHADTTVVDSMLRQIIADQRQAPQPDTTLAKRYKAIYRALDPQSVKNPDTNKKILRVAQEHQPTVGILVMIMGRTASAFSEQGVPDSATVYVTRSFDLLNTVHPVPDHMDYQFQQLFDIYRQRGDYEKTITYADSILNIEGINDITAAFMREAKQIGYASLGDYASSIQETRDILDNIADDKDADYYRLGALVMLISHNNQLQDYNSSRYWLREAQQIDSTPLTAYLYDQMKIQEAELLLGEGHPRASRKKIESTLNLEQAFDDTNYNGSTFVHLMLRHRPLPALNLHVRTFLAENNYGSPALRRSVRRIEHLVRTNPRYRNANARPSLLRVLAEYYSHTGRHEEALGLARAQLDTVTAMDATTQQMMTAYANLHEVQARAGLMDEAYESLIQHQVYADRQTERIRDFQLAQAARAIELDEHGRARRSAEEAVLAEQEASAYRSRLFWLALLAATLVLAALAYAYSRAQKARRAVAAQKIVVDQSLAEKEVLLREIHHRVKNNLQVISGLLQKQARIAGDEGTRQFAREGQERIRSMALVHENLYQSDQLNGVNIKAYLGDLAANIRRGHDSPGTDITLELAAADEHLDLDTAIPIGLILNELLTNAYKYAFPGRDKGTIAVTFARENDRYALTVSDDGVGLPADHATRRSRSLGHNLVNGLVRQLEGSLEWLRPEGGGTMVKISF